MERTRGAKFTIFPLTPLSASVANRKWFVFSFLRDFDLWSFPYLFYFYESVNCYQSQCCCSLWHRRCTCVDILLVKVEGVQSPFRKYSLYYLAHALPVTPFLKDIWRLLERSTFTQCIAISCRIQQAKYPLFCYNKCGSSLNNANSSILLEHYWCAAAIKLYKRPFGFNDSVCTL